jgi:hypothetical protein
LRDVATRHRREQVTKNHLLVRRIAADTSPNFLASPAKTVSVTSADQVPIDRRSM